MTSGPPLGLFFIRFLSCGRYDYDSFFRIIALINFLCYPYSSLDIFLCQYALMKSSFIFLVTFFSVA